METSRRRRLKVALYIPWVYQRGGVERTFLNIIGRSRHDWTVFTNRFEPASTFPEFSKLKVVELQRVGLKRDFAQLAKASLKMLGRRMKLDGFDVLVVSTAGFAELVVALNDYPLPVIAFCHTPLRVIHDPLIRGKYLREHPNPLSRVQYEFFANVYRHAERLAWKKFKFVVVASREVAGRLERAGIVGPERIEFIKYGVDAEKCKARASKPFFLLPGRISWTKNVDLGIRAFEEMAKKHPELSRFKLVIAGGVDAKSEGYFEALRENHKGGRIAFVRNPTDKRLFGLYATCTTVLFTAINEDWGLVPLEAMAFGKPVVAVDQGGPRESVRDGVTGFLAKPRADDVAEKMARLAASPALCRRMGKAGRKRAREYDWKQSARRMDLLLEKALRRDTGKGRKPPE